MFYKAYIHDGMKTVERDKVPAKQGIEGTVNDVMDERIVPSIRR